MFNRNDSILSKDTCSILKSWFLNLGKIKLHVIHFFLLHHCEFVCCSLSHLRTHLWPSLVPSSARSQHRNQSALLHLKKENMRNGWPGRLSSGTARVHNLLDWYLHTQKKRWDTEAGEGVITTEQRGKKERGGGMGLNRRKRNNLVSVITHKSMWGMWDISLCDLLPLGRRRHPSWPMWAPV